MTSQRNQQPVPRIVDLYPSILEAIMGEHRICPLQQSPDDYIVPADANFAEVVQNTDWFCWRGDSRPPYRYNRYQEVLMSTCRRSARRQAHIDIGCGAGLFSWVFLDWARENNVAYDRIDLYGLDHSREMLRLARKMRTRLIVDIPDYPELHYTRFNLALLWWLARDHSPATDYTITFGHALVQTPDDAIRDFALVIATIMEFLDARSSCKVLAVDADKEKVQFGQSWKSLMNKLHNLGIRCQQEEVSATSINDSGRAKIAILSHNLG